MYELRPYQTELIDKVVNSMKTGHKRIIVQSPPRTGKTVVMAEIARRTTANNNRVMFLIHRKEVLDQAKKTFYQQGVKSELLQAGMVQTYARHIDRLKPPTLILVDEAHHVLAKTYRKIIDRFPNAFLLMFTATPVRTGREQMDKIADDIIVGKSIKELTKEGFLAPFRYFKVPSDFNLKDLKISSTGDYSKKSIESANDGKLYGNIVKQYKRIAFGKQAVVYSYDVTSAIKIAQSFNKAGITAKEVDGETDKNVRDKIVEDFRNKKIQILVNVNLFTEGIDLPNVDCTIMARPTASLALYLQFSMRCLNPRPGKTAIIIDHTFNFDNFGFPDDYRNWRNAIRTKKKRNKDNDDNDQGGRDKAIAICDHCFAAVRVRDIKDGKCPVCGKPIKVREEKKTVDIDLVEATKERQKFIKKFIKNKLLKQVAMMNVNELTTYRQFEAYAEIHGYKKGWAYIQCKKRGIFR